MEWLDKVSKARVVDFHKPQWHFQKQSSGSVNKSVVLTGIHKRLGFGEYANRIFVTPRGQGGQGFANVTISESNLKESGRVPGGYAYDVFGIACYPYIVSVQGGVPTPPVPITIFDMSNCINNCVLAWDFLQTQIEIANVHLIGAGGGVFGAGRLGINAGIAAAADNAALTNSNGAIWLYNQHPVMLPSNATFGILLNWGQFSHTPTTQAGETLIIKVNLLGRFQTAIAVG